MADPPRTEGADELQGRSSLVVSSLTEVCPATLPDTQDQAVPLALRRGQQRRGRPAPRVSLADPSRCGSSIRDAGCGAVRDDVLGAEDARSDAAAAGRGLSEDNAGAGPGTTRPPCRCRQGCCGEGLESWLHGRVSGSPEAHWLSLPLRPLALGADLIPYSKSRGGSRAQWGTRRSSLDTPFLGPVAHPLCRLLQASSDPQIRVAPCAPPRVTCSANAGTAEDSRSPPGGEPQSCRR